MNRYRNRNVKIGIVIPSSVNTTVWSAADGYKASMQPMIHVSLFTCKDLYRPVMSQVHGITRSVWTHGQHSALQLLPTQAHSAFMQVPNTEPNSTNHATRKWQGMDYHWRNHHFQFTLSLFLSSPDQDRSWMYIEPNWVDRSWQSPIAPERYLWDETTFKRNKPGDSETFTKYNKHVKTQRLNWFNQLVLLPGAGRFASINPAMKFHMTVESALDSRNLCSHWLGRLLQTKSK